jgi:hypothetical protein
MSCREAPWYNIYHKVRTYKEYHSVCPSSELGLSQPLSRLRVFPSPQKQGGGGTLACGWGVGGESQFRRGAYTMVLFICTYFVIYTVCIVPVIKQIHKYRYHSNELWLTKYYINTNRFFAALRAPVFLLIIPQNGALRD